MNNDSIVIVGGGVSGLAMANALASRGIPSVVIDKRNTPGEIDRGDVLHRSTILTLMQWGIYPKLRMQNPLEFSKFRILNNRGKTIFAIDVGQDIDPSARFTVLRHAAIESFLAEAANHTGLVSIIHGTVCKDLILQGNRVVGVVTPTKTFKAKFTIIATGSNSTLREKFFKWKFRRDYPVSFYYGRFKLISDFADTGFYMVGKSGVMILVPLPHNEMRIGLQYSKHDAHGRISQQQVEDLIHKRMQTFPSESLELIDSNIYPITASLANPIWIPGAVVIGDAAHTVYPIGGQGMNLAFQDAELLAKHLADTEYSNKGLDKGAKLYAHLRQRQLRTILTRIQFFAWWGMVEHPLLVDWREKILIAINLSGIMKKSIFRRIIDGR